MGGRAGVVRCGMRVGLMLAGGHRKGLRRVDTCAQGMGVGVWRCDADMRRGDAHVGHATVRPYRIIPSLFSILRDGINLQ